MSLFNVTSTIQNYTILNRGLMELGGVAVPQAIMANNDVERKERISKSALFFSATFLSPFLMLPLLNKAGLKAFKISKNSHENQIIQLSNKYLDGNLTNMKEGIKELSEDLKASKLFKNADFSRFLKMDDKELETVRKKLIKAKNSIFSADFLYTGIIAGAIPWGVNQITKLFTKRSGFSAEYKMADENYTNQNAAEFERNKNKRFLGFLAITTTAAVLTPLLVASSLLKKNPTGILKTIQKHSEKFDYTNGISMKLLPCFLMDALGACVGEYLSCRDSYERRDFAIRGAFILSVFYAGDQALNNLTGKIIDSVAKTKIINTEKKGFFGHPLRSLQEIKNLKNVDAQTLARTKKLATGMYWANLAICMATLGFALPYALNKLLKSSVKDDLKNQTTSQKR